MSGIRNQVMKKEKVQEYEKLLSQLATMRTQFDNLSKKNPDGSVNSFKIGLVNKLLDDVNDLIGDYKPFPDFDKFDDSPKVFNSDVLMILAHYITAMNRFKKANTTIEKGIGLDTSWMDSVEKWNIED